MRAVVQRVQWAEVNVDEQVTGQISKGYLVLLASSDQDTEEDLKYMVEKTIHLRIFEDAEGKMNLSIKDVGGSILVVSQFTLYGDARKGRRPSFIKAGRPEKAEPLYHQYISMLREYNVPVETGTFGAQMAVKLLNDGPVTILLDSTKVF
jgi:D-aminoacyl-tRNA deacylase